MTARDISTEPVVMTFDTSLPRGLAIALGLSSKSMLLSFSTGYPKYSQNPLQIDLSGVSYKSYQALLEADDECSVGEYILTIFLCMPGSIGMMADPYDLTYSLPL